MERKNNYGIECWTSLGDDLFTRRAKNSRRTLYLNAALAMFLLAPEHEQEEWVDRVARAERTEGETVLAKLKKQLSRDNVTPPPTAGEAVHVDPKLKGATDAKLGDSRPAKKKAS